MAGNAPDFVKNLVPQLGITGHRFGLHLLGGQ